MNRIRRWMFERLPHLGSSRGPGRPPRAALSRTATAAAIVVWRTRAFWMRAFFCWLIGAAFFVADDGSNYDLRFQLRPPRAPNPRIVLLEVSEREWADLVDAGSRGNVLRPLKEIVQATDTYYWKAPIWRDLLARVLESEPASVGVAFYFGDEARFSRWAFGPDAEAARAIFEDPRVIWSAELDAAGRAAPPGLALAYNRNVGLKTLRPDDDGVLRRFVLGLAPVPHLALRLADSIRPEADDSESEALPIEEPGILDFAGPTGTFPSYAFRDVLEGRVDPSAFHGKVVIVGPRDVATAGLASGALTPLGRMSRAEAIANVVESAAKGHWIRRGPTWWYLTGLAALLALSIWALTTYPQSVALTFFVCLGLAWAAASAWAFDERFFWAPVLAPIIQMTATYIVFLSYQLARNEQRAWRLEQERRYADEMESLKTNFVSMMSHDLKTPIAKIQAIADQALASAEPDSRASQDLREILRSSEELHRYIRSILQVTKLEARDFQIKREPIDPNEPLQRAIDRLRPLASQKRIALEANLEPMFSIEADATLIEEVAQNLVENAIKYAPEGGRVLVTSSETDDNVRVCVEDSGPGIDPAEQGRVWDKFTRGRRHSQDVKSPGSGLGLYLVKYFVELHGGSVFLESELGKGSRFGFTIPVATPSAQEAPQARLDAVESDQSRPNAKQSNAERKQELAL